MRTDGVLTPTRVEAGSRCHRRHVAQDILEKGLYQSAAAKFGNVIHAGVAAWWKTGDSSAMIEAAMDEADLWRDVLNEKTSPEFACSLLEKYPKEAKLAGPFNDEYKVVTIEERLAVPVNFGALSGMTFQLDRLLSFNNERLLLVDTKTAARIDMKWRGQWNRTLQMRLYKRLIEQMYDMPVDIVIEGIQKGPFKLEYFVCPEWSAGELQEALEQAERVAQRDKVVLDILVNEGEEAMIEYALTKTDFNYQDCRSYNVDCPFMKLCEAPIEQRRGLLSEYLDISAEY